MFTRRLFFILVCCSLSSKIIYSNQKEDRELKNKIAKLSEVECKKHLLEVIKERDDQTIEIKNIIAKEERRQSKINGYIGACLLVCGIVSLSKTLEEKGIFNAFVTGLTLLTGIMMTGQALFKKSILQKIHDEITPDEDEFEECE